MCKGFSFYLSTVIFETLKYTINNLVSQKNHYIKVFLLQRWMSSFRLSSYRELLHLFLIEILVNAISSYLCFNLLWFAILFWITWKDRYFEQNSNIINSFSFTRGTQWSAILSILCYDSLLCELAILLSSLEFSFHRSRNHHIYFSTCWQQFPGNNLWALRAEKTQKSSNLKKMISYI